MLDDLRKHASATIEDVNTLTEMEIEFNTVVKKKIEYIITNLIFADVPSKQDLIGPADLPSIDEVEQKAERLKKLNDDVNEYNECIAKLNEKQANALNKFTRIVEDALD